MCIAKRNDNLSDTEIEYHLHSFTFMPPLRLLSVMRLCIVYGIPLAILIQ